MIRPLFLILLSFALSGCDMLRAGFMEPAEKINAAFPLPQVLRQAHKQLLSDPELDRAQAQALERQYQQRLRVRAMTCSNNAAPARFDSLADLRRKITDSGCFHRHDVALQEWIGVQRFLLALRKPPLAPDGPLPVHTLLAPAEPAVEVIAARDANVVVLRGAQGQLTTIALPSGKTLSSFAAPAPDGRPASLSPNGHVLAVPVRDALRMLDPGTGDTLWTTTRFTEVTAWLPEIEATVLAPRGAQRPAVLDQRSGAIQPHPLPLPALTWSLPSTGGTARQVMGNASSAFVVDHSRRADGSVGAAIVTQRAVPEPGLTDLPPLLMDQGRKLVFGSGNDLRWLDFDSEATGLWNVAPLRARGFAKNSETTLVLDVDLPGREPGPRLLDIERATLSRVEGASAESGVLAPLAGRDGWARRDRVVTLGYGAAPEGPPEPLGQVIAGAGLGAGNTP